MNRFGKINKNSMLSILISAIFAAGGISSCGGGKLIPRELKDYVAYALKTPRRNVEVDQTFNTTITLRVERMGYSDAELTMKELVMKCVEYFRRDKVSDFIQETVIFHIRLTSDADQYMKWTTSATQLRDFVKDNMGENEFFELCEKESIW